MPHERTISPSEKDLKPGSQYASTPCGSGLGSPAQPLVEYCRFAVSQYEHATELLVPVVLPAVRLKRIGVARPETLTALLFAPVLEKESRATFGAVEVVVAQCC